MESITDADCKHTKRVWKDSGLQNLSQYHDLSDARLLSDTLKSFRNKCLEIFEQYPANLAEMFQENRRRTKIISKHRYVTNSKLRYQVSGVECVNAVYRYAKVNNKYMKNYGRSTESSYLMYWDVKNLCGWSMPQKLSVCGFKWKKKKFRFIQKFLQNYDDDSNTEYNYELDVSYLSRMQKIHKIDKCQKLKYSM